MSASLKFKFIEQNLMNILMLVVTNQNILRYIKYLNDDPLDDYLPDVEGTLINEHIILSPFDKEVASVSEVKLFFYPFKSHLKSKPLGKHVYMFDIICPIRYFILQGRGEFRTIRIADEIARMIDGQTITGIGEITIPDAYLSRLSNDSNYVIYSLPVEVNTATIKGS